MRAEVRQDLGPAVGLLGGVSQDRDAGILGEPGGLVARRIGGRGAGGVGDDEQACARVGAAEPLEMRLAAVASVGDLTRRPGCKGGVRVYLVGRVDGIFVRHGEAVVLVEDHGADVGALAFRVRREGVRERDWEVVESRDGGVGEAQGGVAEEAEGPQDTGDIHQDDDATGTRSLKTSSRALESLFLFGVSGV